MYLWRTVEKQVIYREIVKMAEKWRLVKEHAGHHEAAEDRKEGTGAGGVGNQQGMSGHRANQQQEKYEERNGWLTMVDSHGAQY